MLFANHIPGIDLTIMGSGHSSAGPPSCGIRNITRAAM